MIGRLGLLIGGSLAFWALVALAGYYLWGNTVAVYSAVALVLCLIPTVSTLAWVGSGWQPSPEQQLIRILAATGIRIVLVLAGALALYLLFPYFQEGPGFFIWVVVFYVFTLGLETLLLVSRRGAARNS